VGKIAVLMRRIHHWFSMPLDEFLDANGNPAKFVRHGDDLIVAPVVPAEQAEHLEPIVEPREVAVTSE
jgi:hypothetical protein